MFLKTYNLFSLNKRRQLTNEFWKITVRILSSLEGESLNAMMRNFGEYCAFWNWMVEYCTLDV